MISRMTVDKTSIDVMTVHKMAWHHRGNVVESGRLNFFSLTEIVLKKFKKTFFTAYLIQFHQCVSSQAPRHFFNLPFHLPAKNSYNGSKGVYKYVISST